MPDYQLSKKELDAIRHIRVSLLQRGQAPSVRELQVLLGYRSPRSASDILKKLQDRGIVRRRGDGQLQLIRDPGEERHNARTVDVPLVGSVACGAAFLAEENVEALVPVSVGLARPPHRYFLLRAVGDSMNEAGIEEGDLVLVRQQLTAENGDQVVALLDDDATIKEFQRRGDVVVLNPKSRNKQHKPILLTHDFQVQGIVVGIVPNLTKR